MSKKVTVLLGGFSAEREVSLVSGGACAEALREAGYDVTEVDVTRDIAKLLQDLTPKPDVIFNALHGRWGEDGCVQGLLEMLDVPYSHSGVLASALAMDKQAAKIAVAQAGVTCPKGRVIGPDDLEKSDPLPRPYVIKPLCDGSSVGVYIVREGDNRPNLTRESWSHGERILAEEYIPGRELTVSVMGDRALEVTEIAPRTGFYDYRAKYTDGYADHLVPAPVPKTIREQALAAAVTCHSVLGCRGISRTDYRYNDSGEGPAGLFYLETNTQPGMTPLSLVPEQAKYLGISFPELCSWMVEQATCDG